MIVLASTTVAAFAGLNLQNGDFSSGLSAWTVEYGSVTDDDRCEVGQRERIGCSPPRRAAAGPCGDWRGYGWSSAQR
jgi:hypothetical protein